MHHVRRNTTPVFQSMVEDLHLDVFASSNAAPLLSAASTIEAIWLSAGEAVPSLGVPPRSSLYSDMATDDEQGGAIGIATDEENIRRDLGLSPGLCAEQVSHLRRQFARRNHPDLFPLQLRPLATVRMTIANALCDAYFS